MAKTKNRIPKDILDKAKQMYMDHHSPKFIASELDLNHHSINYYITNYWREERDTELYDHINALTVKKKSEFLNITEDAICVMQRAIKHLAVRPDPPTIREAESVAKVYQMVDAIGRLDRKEPTEIIATEKPVTTIELKNMINKDPFAQVEEVEYTEKKDEEVL